VGKTSLIKGLVKHYTWQTACNYSLILQLNPLYMLLLNPAGGQDQPDQGFTGLIKGLLKHYAWQQPPSIALT
jgi:hypothetical protein